MIERYRQIVMGAAGAIGLGAMIGGFTVSAMDAPAIEMRYPDVEIQPVVEHPVYDPPIGVVHARFGPNSQRFADEFGDRTPFAEPTNDWPNTVSTVDPYEPPALSHAAAAPDEDRSFDTGDQTVESQTAADLG